MTPAPPELTIRPLAGADELGLFRRLSYVLDHELADDLATGRRRPDWMWVALRGDRVLGRPSWWTGQEGGSPQFLDFFDLDDTLPEPERGAIGLELLEKATAAVVPAGSPGLSTAGSSPRTGARTPPRAMSSRPGYG